jgi:hypothetical protein
MIVKSSRLRLKEFMKNGGTVIRCITECFLSIVYSRKVYTVLVWYFHELKRETLPDWSKRPLEIPPRQ